MALLYDVGLGQRRVKGAPGTKRKGGRLRETKRATKEGGASANGGEVEASSVDGQG